jgi:hypothetical protein
LFNDPRFEEGLILFWLAVPIATPQNVHGVEINSSAFAIVWDDIPTTRELMRGKRLGVQVSNLLIKMIK